jgi:hypothetical protein
MYFKNNIKVNHEMIYAYYIPVGQCIMLSKELQNL